MNADPGRHVLEEVARALRAAGFVTTTDLCREARAAEPKVRRWAAEGWLPCLDPAPGSGQMLWFAPAAVPIARALERLSGTVKLRVAAPAVRDALQDGRSGVLEVAPGVIIDLDVLSK